MERTKNRVVWITTTCLVIGMLLAGGCSSSTVRTYSGDPRPLEQVAVLVTNSDSCPVFKIDGEFGDLNRKPGAEFQLMPGSHTVEVFYQTKAADGSLTIERASLEFPFSAGRVYVVKKTLHPIEPEKLAASAWTPNIQDLGDVVSYARENPKYFASSKDWKKLRRENDLTPSFFDFLKKKKSTDLASDTSATIKK